MFIVTVRELCVKRMRLIVPLEKVSGKGEAAHRCKGAVGAGSLLSAVRLVARMMGMSEALRANCAALSSFAATRFLF